MAHPDYIRQKAIRLRLESHLSIDEIAERLALSKTTIYSWVKDLPLGRERNWTEGQRKAYQANRDNAKRRRDEAYAQGVAEFDELAANPSFLQFVALYIAEGSKRDRNQVAICNSDERIVAFATGWLRILSGKEPTFWIQFHADQDLDELRRFWSEVVGIDGGEIHFQRKSNSGRLGGRSWRSAHGVLTVRVSDTMLRARLQAWIDRVRAGWQLDSAKTNGA